MRRVQCHHCDGLEWTGHAWRRDDLILCTKCWDVRREMKDPLVFEDSGAIRWSRKRMRWESVDLEVLPTWDPKTRTWVTVHTDEEIAQIIADVIRGKGTDWENEVYVDAHALCSVCIDGWSDLIYVARTLREKGIIR